MKKLLAFAISLIMAFQILIPIGSAEGYEIEYITLHNGLDSKAISIIQKDDEIYAPVDELNWIFEKHVNSKGEQRFVLKENDINLVFNLGEKYVMFSKDDKKIVVDPVSYSQDYSGTLVHEGKYYYPLSEILPWMNVECSVDNGVLVVKPDMKSVWEISKEIKQDNYQFNIIEELGDSTSTVAALVAAHVIDGFFAVFSLEIERLIIVDDEQPDSWHTVNNYYDCLTEMATDDFMISEQAEKILKNIKTVNKFDESIRDFFDMTNADVDMESVLSGYETDKTKGADYAEMCNQFKMASDMADLAKGVGKVLPVLKTIEATSHVLPGYFDALMFQQNNVDNSMAYQLALDRSVTALSGKLPAIFTGITDFVLTGAFEDLGSALGKDYSKIFFVEGFSGAVGAVESVLTLVWPVNKAASDVAKLSVYYDIQRSSFETANKYKFEATSEDNVHLMRVNYMLSLLASKKSYKAMKKVLDLIKQGDLKQNDIDKIDLMLVELAYAESAEENDAICDKSEKTTTIKDTLNEVDFITILETNYDKYGKYLDKDMEFALKDFPSSDKFPLEGGGRDTTALRINEKVSLVYNGNVCTSYYCTAADLYPKMASEKPRMTKGEFENYLGVSVFFWSGEQDPDGEPGICYNHNGYTIYINCDDDGTIIFDDAIFSVHEEQFIYGYTSPTTTEPIDLSSVYIETNPVSVDETTEDKIRNYAIRELGANYEMDGMVFEYVYQVHGIINYSNNQYYWITSRQKVPGTGRVSYLGDILILTDFSHHYSAYHHQDGLIVDFTS